MRIALLGATGMLGSKAAEVFRARGHELLAPPRAEADLGRPHTLERFFRDRDFEVLVNCAGFTRVDACEEAARFSSALNVNGTAVGWLAQFCRKSGRTLVHYSTDYVYDGRKEGPYLESDEPAPLNAYGRTKWQGDKLVLSESPFYYLIRTSWVFGPHGPNFVRTMAGLLKAKRSVEVVSDQVGGPTYTGDLAAFTAELLEKKAAPGLYQFANAGHTSWYGFAREIRKQTGLTSCEVVSVPGENIFRPAQRPANSRFDLAKASQALGRPPRPWEEALKDYLQEDFQ